MSTRYAASHHRLLSRAQTDSFIAALDNARTAQDVEKAIEQAINSLLVAGLQAAHPDSSVTHDYRHSTDGYITVGSSPSLAQPYALLVEAKRDLDFSGSRRDVATVLTQVCHYLRAIGRAGDRVPTVTVVCDTDEVFAIPTTVLAGYIADDSYAWDKHSASTMHKDGSLLAALIKDSNVRPYVHDIATGFDADMFIWAVDAMGRGDKPVKVAVNAASLEHVFTRFKMEVLGTDATGLKNKDEISLFIDVLRGSDDIFAHPKKANTLLWGTKHITVDTYRFERFWSQYVVGDYTLAELKSLTEMGDVLLVDTERRFSGDFWTPPRWVDKAHEYIEAALGDNWKQDYVVVDPACGTLNLTRDYLFGELYSSTLFQEELDIAADYNPEATKFQYDFLNDDMELHEDGMTPAKARELVRSGKLKMPQGLATALADNKPVVFFANPPYGQSGSGQGRTHKAGVNNTAVGELMNGLGHARMELYTQFIWRTKELAKVFGYTSDFHFFFFNKTFLTSPNFGKFVNELTAEFTYCDGFMLNAGEFNGTSSAWGVIFSHFEIGGTNQREFTYTVLESNKDMSIDTLTEWTGRSVSKGETLSDWVNDKASTAPAAADVPVTKNGYDEPTSKTNRANPKQGGIAYLGWNQCNVQGSDKYVCLFSMPQGRDSSYTITKDNLTRAAVTFSIRRAVQEVIAEQKLLWVRDKDIFTRPPESLLTPEFIADCMVYSLFDRQSNQTSLRNYEYKGRTYRVVNEFFPWSKKSMIELSQRHHNRAVEADATGDTDRAVYGWLADHARDVSPEADAVMSRAWQVVWYDLYYEDFRAVRKALGDKIAHAAMDAGVI
ncbi:MAG: hypothetical protein DI609_00380 [Corynebacterium urealyticum]|uniref:Uncharacterized protein n=1 Tax=Corynebacterium urealyticum TaxID=43771 RepID=A0A2W5BAG6_9CORY|nr:MAG: hypothetical protein DI609_00380 [Corynebacterium urealyticum]